MEVERVKEIEPDVEDSIQKLPLEIITKIVKHLSLKDVLSLAAVSKIWRSVYLNQNVIWKDICLNLSIREDDFIHCITNRKPLHRAVNHYIDIKSQILFGKMCSWWMAYVRYNMVLKNIIYNDYPILRLVREHVEQSYCTDDYIINVYRVKTKVPIEVVNLQHSFNGEQHIEKNYLLNFEVFETLYNMEYSLSITCNKMFLVLEIRSVIFVYTIHNGEFIPAFWKTIQKAADYDPKNEDKLPDLKFFNDKEDTKIDLWEDKLALIHPNDNVIFLVDLTHAIISKELIYSPVICTVDCMKCAEERLMIGISFKGPTKEEYAGIVYHFDNKPTENKEFTITLYGKVTEFKVTKNYIGIENRAPATPFITKVTNLIHIFWIECDTFSFDNTRKFIYYNVNRSIFKYDLNKSRLDRYEVTQKIANDAISNNFSLTPINDRFLFICSALANIDETETLTNSYDVFDVTSYNTVRSFLFPGYRLAHVGNAAVIFYSDKEFIIIRFY